jgi:cyclopropane fatty-acyl-phospholipid synthase-like methyltransferase
MKTALLCCLMLGAAGPAAAQEYYEHSDIIYVPTSMEIVEAMLKLAAVNKDDVVYDLGCGDGRIVIMAAEKFQARGVGVEINPELIRESEENARKAKVSELVRFVEKDLFEAAVDGATVVMLYVGAEPNLKLRPKLLKQLKPGARVVSHNYDMGDWKPDKTERIEDRTLYLWTVTEEARRAFAGE